MVDALQAERHKVIGVGNAEAVPEMLILGLVDLMVIDLNLPGEDGISLTRRVRTSHPTIGIVHVTARNHPEQRAEGYQSGADIYLTKPVALNELLAAIHSLTRRLQTGKAARQDKLTLSTSRLTLVGHGGLSVSLSAAESTLLNGLCLANGQRLEKWQILTLLHREEAQDQLAAIELVIVRLRKKIRLAGFHEPSIKVIRNWGYQLCAPIVSLD